MANVFQSTKLMQWIWAFRPQCYKQALSRKRQLKVLLQMLFKTEHQQITDKMKLLLLRVYQLLADYFILFRLACSQKKYHGASYLIWIRYTRKRLLTATFFITQGHIKV